ncbi:MAG: VWA domain-containing protein [Acidobacteriota bacterium]|nr:VWA domain-containing protein [Acidobacteriota bacterium]
MIAFGAPPLLWLLAAPALLIALWVWRFVRRLSDLRRLRERRSVPIRERFALAGDLPFWLSIILASSLLIVALARPRGMTTAIGRAGVDIVVLQDGSASMHVTDVPGNRWQRSMRFLRVLGDSLSWNDDRMALTVFAHISTPQIRLTNDPNTVFFFLDHLQDRPPFRLEDDTTWDTNLEQGIAWGLRLIEKDRDIHGPSPNARLFVLISDGESWSGEVARAIQKANEANVPLFVIGAGTLSGGMLPAFRNEDDVEEASPGRSRLDRASLLRIAAAGGGRYFELDRDPDRDIANTIIDAGRRQAPTKVEEGKVQELYWRFLAAAVAAAAIGAIFLRERAELAMQVAGAGLTALSLAGLLW